jgi:hypothetical protein
MVLRLAFRSLNPAPMYPTHTSELHHMIDLPSLRLCCNAVINTISQLLPYTKAAQLVYRVQQRTAGRVETELAERADNIVGDRSPARSADLSTFRTKVFQSAAVAGGVETAGAGGGGAVLRGLGSLASAIGAFSRVSRLWRGNWREGGLRLRQVLEVHWDHAVFAWSGQPLRLLFYHLLVS